MRETAPPSSRTPLHRNRWLRTLFFFGIAVCVLILVLDLPQTQNIVVDLPRGPDAGNVTELEMRWSTSGTSLGSASAQTKAESLGGTTWAFPEGAPRRVQTDLVVPNGHYSLMFRWSGVGPKGVPVTASDVHDVEFAGDGVHIYLKPSSR